MIFTKEGNTENSKENPPDKQQPRTYSPFSHIPPYQKFYYEFALFLMRKKMPVNAKAPAMRKHDWGNEGCDIIAKGYKRVRLWEPREAGVARYDQRL